MRTGIVGGGITGVSIAYRLSMQGEPVGLFERSGQLGGLAGSFKLGNVWLEKYFHHIFLSDEALRGLIRDVGLESDMIWRKTPMGVYAEGEIHSFDSPIDLLRFSPLSWADRLRFGYRILRTGRDPNGLAIDTITVQEWVEKVWGGQIYSRFWRPLLIAKFGDAADKISAAWLWGRIYARANSRAGISEKLGYLRGGFIRLLEAMGERIQSKGSKIHLLSEVVQVMKTPDKKWEIQTKDQRFVFDRLVLAVPSPVIAEIVKDLPEDERKKHASIAYQGVSCMVVVLTKLLSRIYWLNVGDRTIPYSGVIEQTNFIPKEEYEGDHVAYLFNYLPQGHPWMSEEKEKVFQRYEAGLKRMFPEYRRENVVRTMLFRDSFATPIYEVNYMQKMPPMVSKYEGLYFSNTAHIFPNDRNMNYSVELAGRLLEAMEKGEA